MAGVSAVRLAEVFGGKSESSCLRTPAALFSISKLEPGVIRFSVLAGLKVEFKFLQLGIKPGTVLEELGMRARILRVDVESFGRCHFVSDAGSGGLSW